MRILFVTIGLPYPISHGAHLRLYNLMKQLSRSHDLYLLSLEDGTSIQSDVKYISKMIKKSFFEKIPNKTTGILKKVMVLPYYKRSVSCKIKKIVECFNIDIIHYHYPRSAEFGLYAGKYGVRQVLDCVDSRVLLYKRSMVRTDISGVRPTLKHYINQMRVSRIERKLVTLADASVVVSPIDAKCLKKHCPASKVFVIPNGVNFDYFSIRESASDINGGGKNIVFVGNMDFLPNIQAALYFVKEIFPLIRERNNNAIFYIVGKNPVKKIKELEQEKSVKVLGYVDDVRDYYEMADVVVVPMVSGGGIKNKALEAFSMGCPVVASSMGMEAIDAVPDVHVKISDSAEQFANDVVHLLQAPGEAAIIGKNARQLVEKEYSWVSTAEKFSKLYYQMTNEKL